MTRHLPAAALFLVVMALVSAVTRAPGDKPARWRERTTGIEFVLVQPQSFEMGTPEDVPGREPQEVRHRVQLTRAYYLGQYEVTQGQWRTLMDSNPSHFPGCDRCPVERVNYFEVEEFIRRLNARSGPGFRLPTEAEWELACRAGGSGPFGHSSALDSRDANIDGTYPYAAPIGPSRGRTTAVGQFAPNPWGLFDMAGNVWEWVQDRHCPYAEGPAVDPVGACASPYRVIRGGSWKFDGNSARCGLRYTHRPQDRGFSLGFRLARTAN
jgi:formylglycine-generating enzyme required for sulfatase activity